MARTPAGRGAHQYRLIVPLDASAIEDFKPDQRVKVAVQDRTGVLQSQLVELDNAGHGRATFAFAAHPGTLLVILGPSNASDQDLTRLQTITVNVLARQWGERPELTLPAIRIAPYYWYWWFVWCREFTIRGVVVCANGQPVPGATVCAYDVDWWWWSSTQLIKCATTDASGAFEIKFTWCCGWWPWWWWEQRFWRLEPSLVERIVPVLGRDSELGRVLRPTPQPSLADFRQLLGADAALISNAPTIDPAALPALRTRLLTRLPAAAELERLRIWPWWPWWPWWDCAPDVIFRVTQNCAPTAAGGSTVILDETIWDARWDIPTTLNVTLVAGDNACCVPQSHPCQDGECLALTGACDEQAGFGRLDNIGGNTGAPAGPVGYESPGAGTTYSDRPYAGSVSIFGTADCMDGVDYYEFEWNTSLAAPNDPSWKTMPPAANGDFVRSYIQFVPFGFFNPTFSASVPIDGHHVYETLQHYESGHPPGRLEQQPYLDRQSGSADLVADRKQFHRRNLLSACQGLEHRRRRPSDQPARTQHLRQPEPELHRAAGRQPLCRSGADRLARQSLQQRSALLHRRARHRLRQRIHPSRRPHDRPARGMRQRAGHRG
jgi:hypothetical protein